MLKRYKHILIVPIFMTFYMAAFVYLEQSSTGIHVIHTKLDDYIPFCR